MEYHGYSGAAKSQLIFLPRWLLVFLIVAGFALGTSSVSAALPAFPDNFPATPIPKLKGCSNKQKEVLKIVWELAHFYTWRADQLLDHINSKPKSQRAALWKQDLVANTSLSPSPYTWFGPYDSDRAKFISTAVDKARKRFQKKGKTVKWISKLRCGQPIAKAKNIHTDVCPKSGSGGSRPAAYHTPVGTIVTCPKFWDRLNDSSKTEDDRLKSAARGLVHEMFHWLSVGGKYVVDYHADGAGGMKDDHYYGADAALKLAKKKRSWARRNNDNFAWFAYRVGTHKPFFSANWAVRTDSGTGAVYVNQSWDSLLNKRQQFKNKQYLVDIETYIKRGKRRYTGVWRIGKGQGAIGNGTPQVFVDEWKKRKSKQHLIDIERYSAGGTAKLVGVFRFKQKNEGDGGLHTSLTWDQLVEKWNVYSDIAYLADIETYVSGGKRKYIGLWLPGGARSNLYSTKSWEAFRDLKKKLNPDYDLVDFERYRDKGGNWHFVGVWREGKRSGQLYKRETWSGVMDRWDSLKSDFTLVDVEPHYSLVDAIK